MEIGEYNIAASTEISRFIAMLSRNFHLDEEDKLFKHPDADIRKDQGANPLSQAETNRRTEAPTAELPAQKAGK